MSDDKLMIHFPCAHCKHPLQTKAKNIGREFQCPKCDHLVHVPSLGEKTEHGHTWDTHIARFTSERSTTKRQGKDAK